METDIRGYFRLIALAVGTYQVRFALIGYRPVVFNDVIVGLGRTTSLGEIRWSRRRSSWARSWSRPSRHCWISRSAAAATNISSEQFRISSDRPQFPLDHQPGSRSRPQRLP